MTWLVPSARCGMYQCRWFLLRPMTRIQKLTRFQDHFDDVFVAVIFRTLAWAPVEEEDIHLVGVGGRAAAGWVSGGGGNTFWLKRSSAFAGERPRYTISIFNLRRDVRRESVSGSGIITYYNSIRFRTALLNVLGWKGMSIFVASASMIYFVEVYWFIRK